RWRWFAICIHGLWRQWRRGHLDHPLTATDADLGTDDEDEAPSLREVVRELSDTLVCDLVCLSESRTWPVAETQDIGHADSLMRQFPAIFQHEIFEPGDLPLLD